VRAKAMGCSTSILSLMDNTDKTIFWYEESDPLRVATDNFWPLISIQLFADTIFMLSFILNDFYSCTGYFSYLVSAISTNVWLLSASLYDNSIFKHILAGLNLFRTTSFLLFNDSKCKYSPKFGMKLANSKKP